LSYTKQENEYGCKAIPFSNGSNWEFAEVLYETFMELRVQMNGLAQELILLKNNPHLLNLKNTYQLSQFPL